MGIFIKFDNITEVKAIVNYIDYYPQNLSEEILAKGIVVESIPAPEVKPFKNPILYINPQTNELFHEYIDRELTTEETLLKDNQLLREQLDRVTETLDMVLIDLIPSLLGGGETE